MKLSYSSNANMQFSIEETIRRIAALGYGGLELLADVPHAWPAGLLDERKPPNHALAVSRTFFWQILTRIGLRQWPT